MHSKIISLLMMVRYHTGFVNDVVQAAENDTFGKAVWHRHLATKLCWKNMEMITPGMTFASHLSNAIRPIGVLAQLGKFIQLKSTQSSSRPHEVSETLHMILELYDLSHEPATDIKSKNTYLLEDDRFICHPSKHEVSSFLITSPIRPQMAYCSQNVASDFLPRIYLFFLFFFFSFFFFILYIRC